MALDEMRKTCGLGFRSLAVDSFPHPPAPKFGEQRAAVQLRDVAVEVFGVH